MPLLKISGSTMQLVRAKRPPGFQFAATAIRTDDGWWLVPVNDEVAVLVALERVRGECDDGVTARLLQDDYRQWKPLTSSYASLAARQSR
jgi:hypothetical protein